MGKCGAGAWATVAVPDEFRLRATIYDYDDWVHDAPPIVDVEMIDYKSGQIWYGGGFLSSSYKLEFAGEREVR